MNRDEPAGGLPLQLIGDWYFPRVDPGAADGVKFLRLVAKARGLNPASDDKIADALTGRTGDDAKMDLLDADAALANLPGDVASKARSLRSDLVNALEPFVPVPAGETLRSLQATCLASGFGHLPKGTVVVAQTTSRAERLLVLPLVTFDIATGAASVSLPHLDHATAAAATVIRATKGEDVLKGILQIGGILAFAMPPPWGAVGAAGATLAQLLVGAADSAPDPFAIVVQSIETYLQEKQVEEWSNTVYNFLGGANGLQTQLAALKDTESLDQTVFINDTLLPLVNDATNAGRSDNVNAAVAGLSNFVHNLAKDARNESREKYHKNKTLALESALDLSLMATSALLVGLKFRIQLYATLATAAQSNGDNEGFIKHTGAWLDAYAVYELTIRGESPKKPGVAGNATHMIAAVRKARLGLIGNPYSVSASFAGGKQETFKEYGWGFTDAAVEDPSIDKAVYVNKAPKFPKHFVADTPPKSCCGSPKRHKDKLEQKRERYIKSIGAKIDQRAQVVSGWTDSIQEWSSHLPPQPPSTSPSIAGDAKWTAKTPQGQNWVKGNAVAYAVAFANSSGPSQPGRFSAWIDIGDEAFPTVTVPTDPLSMASARHLYRRFKTQPDKPEIIGVIPDNTTTTYVDDRP
jgi:hypothetical protein